MEDYSIPAQAFQAPKESGGIVQQGVMPIVAIADDRIIPLGSGFVVGGGGVMMTAKHVVEEYFSGKIKDRETGIGYATQGLYALFVTNEKHESGQEKGMHLGGLWPIDFVWKTPELDIAYCWLRSLSRNGKPFTPPVSFKLSPGMPAVGDKILGFGYYKSIGGVIEHGADGKRIVDYKQQSAFSSGTIRTIYRDRRDSVMLSFPSFETTARFEPGLSGGPVMNETGGVCGVVTSSYSGLIEGGYISYASLVWPSLGMTLEMVPTGGTKLQSFSVYELCQMGVISCDQSIGQVQLIDNGASKQIILKHPAKG